MKRIVFFLAGLIAASAPLSAIEIASVYTDLKPIDCITIDQAGKGEGNWAVRVCRGANGYPVIMDTDDARESVFYGFPEIRKKGRVWESFEGFNSTSKKIEWRVRKNGELTVPYATIHRWSVTSPEAKERRIEVLVVERVGQPSDGSGCAVGLVVATGNPKANKTAREIADGKAENFSCGTDKPALIGKPMPIFTRQKD